jgi:divalent metal cation (Fe/Co/Zn/Cd) transporter
LQRRGLRLEYATIGWNVGEAVLTIALGAAAGSLALIGFGTDSVVEVFASSVVVWHLRPAPAAADAEARTRLALRLVAAAFAALAVVLAAASIRQLALQERAGRSIPGIVYLAVTALVMLGLAVAKRRTARALGSAPLGAEATLTMLDALLSTLTLLGLALNAFLHWWWADPGAALFVAVAAANECRENWMEARALAPEASRGPGVA